MTPRVIATFGHAGEPSFRVVVTKDRGPMVERAGYSVDALGERHIQWRLDRELTSQERDALTACIQMLASGARDSVYVLTGEALS